MNTQTLLLVLFDICLIIGLARLMGHLFARFNQPPVMGEIVAGIRKKSFRIRPLGCWLLPVPRWMTLRLGVYWRW